MNKGVTTSSKSQQILKYMVFIAQDLQCYEEYYEIATAEHIKLKRGKRIQKQKNMAVMEESVTLEDIETGKKSKKPKYFKMKVVDTHKMDSIDQVIQENAD